MNSEIDHQSSPAADPAPAAAPPKAVDNDDNDDDHFLADLIDLIPRLAQHDRQTFLQHYDPNAAVQWLMYVLDPNNQVKNPAGYLRRCCLQQSHQPPASYTQHEVRSLLSQLKKPPAHSGNDAAAGTADTTQSEQPPGPDINTDHQSSPAADPAPAAAPPEAVDDDDDDDHFLADLIADLIDLIPRLAQHDRQIFLQRYDPNAAVQWLMYVLDPNNQVKNPAGYLRRCCLQQSHQPPASYTQHEVRSLLSQLKKPPAHSGNDAAAGTADTTQSEQPPGPDINTQAVSHWRNAMTELEMQFTRSAFDRWLKPAYLLAWDDDRVTIGVPDEYAKEWLESRWRRPIERTLTGIAGRLTAFQCVTMPA